MRRAWASIGPAAALLFCSPAPAGQGATASSPVELARAAGQLKPGEWVWAPQIAPAGPITIYVDLSTQRATVYRNGVRIAVSTVSSGKPGHETPTGVFTILQKDARHRSSKYNNAAMPFTQRLTWDGVALHAGGLPGYPESHGCVHLPLGFSRALFGITALGGTVVIAGAAARHVDTDAAGVLAPLPPTTAVAGGGSSWQPERSPTGPMTIVVSRSDQMAIVLRNGVEIGRSPISLPRGIQETHVLTLTRGADGQPRWIRVGVPGQEGVGGTPLDDETLSQVHIPPRFYRQVQDAAVPGTTILVTQASLSTGGTGRKLTLIDGGATAP